MFTNLFVLQFFLTWNLLGTAALFIATKYEEIYPPEIGEFVYITDDSFTKLQILQMEKLVLQVCSSWTSENILNPFDFSLFRLWILTCPLRLPITFLKSM